ncbi:alpha-amylase family glycosyl hydrolase [Sphingomonas sp. DT-204]
MTAIWLTLVFRNQIVQGEGSRADAGYRGYWGLDFTDVPPHFGTGADYKTFVDAAHARGLKVCFDAVDPEFWDRCRCTGSAICLAGCTVPIPGSDVERRVPSAR